MKVNQQDRLGVSKRGSKCMFEVTESKDTKEAGGFSNT